MSVPVIRAKFKLDWIKRSLSMVPTKDAEGRPTLDDKGYNVYETREVHELVATPVYGNGDPNHENSKFWAASPGGELRLTCVNAEAVAKLELGKEFYLDFTPAEG